jgi:hypothetical protein
MLASLDTPLELFGWRAMLKGLAAQQRWSDIDARAAQARARCSALKQEASSRCAEIAALAVQARAALGDGAVALAAADALLARIADGQLGGEAPAQAHLARAMALQATGDAEAARREREAALAALRARYVESHRDVRRLAALLAAPG